MLLLLFFLPLPDLISSLPSSGLLDFCPGSGVGQCGRAYWVQPESTPLRPLLSGLIGVGVGRRGTFVFICKYL